jgi:hypothetical protein
LGNKVGFYENERKIKDIEGNECAPKIKQNPESHGEIAGWYFFDPCDKQRGERKEEKQYTAKPSHFFIKIIKGFAAQFMYKNKTASNKQTADCIRKPHP